jgi:GNAT superfamily N-acetyltransferase
MHPAAPEIEYRAEVPEPVAFVRLFATTGWDPQGRLTVATAAEALAHTWYAVSAYDGTRLVGTGRIIGDGVLHALLVDVIVDPDCRHRGIGSGMVERLVAECRRHRIFYTQLFCARGNRRFYERLGFAARPEMRRGWSWWRRMRKPKERRGAGPAVGRMPTGGVLMTRRRSLVSKLYRTARLANDVSVLASGNPHRIARRAKNTTIGRTLGAGGFWRMLWCGGRRA